MDPMSSNFPPRKIKSNYSVQIQFPNDELTEEEEEEEEKDGARGFRSFDFLDICASDDFRMYEFKVRRCRWARSHDWTDCPFAHPGEKARRRDPRKYHYAAAGCPDYKSRGGDCPRGDGCEFAHGVFECWLHPARYRTTPCKDGRGCRRKVCFFAHTRQQLRVLTSTTSAASSPSSPPMFLSPKSTLVGFGASPPVSPPMGGCVKRRRRPGRCSFGELVSQLDAMEISLAVAGSSIISTGGGTESGYYAPDLDWVDELLQ